MSENTVLQTLKKRANFGACIAWTRLTNRVETSPENRTELIFFRKNGSKNLYPTWFLFFWLVNISATANSYLENASNISSGVIFKRWGTKWSQSIKNVYACVQTLTLGFSNLSPGITSADRMWLFCNQAVMKEPNCVSATSPAGHGVPLERREPPHNELLLAWTTLQPARLSGDCRVNRNPSIQQLLFNQMCSSNVIVQRNNPQLRESPLSFRRVPLFLKP